MEDETDNTLLEQNNSPKTQKIDDEEENRGVIYLSRIPTKMSVTVLRHTLSKFGELGRIFLQVDEKKSRKKRYRGFTEGWVEFLDKKVAKRVAKALNTQMIGGKRRNPWYEELWNMKYLPKFKWFHLTERLSYEREVHRQRMTAEIAQVKRETDHYIKNVSRQNYAKRKNLEGNTEEWTFDQKVTEDERAKKLSERAAAKSKKRKVSKLADDKSFLASLFTGDKE